MPEQRGDGVHRHGVALLTGAHGDIGRAILDRFVRDGFAVAALDRHPDVLGLAELGTADSPVHPIHADVLDAAQCRAAVETTAAVLGPIDVLVNNAGVMAKKPLHEHTVDDWDTALDVNARAAFVFCREVLPGMAARGSGAVVNLASVWASRGGPDRAAYIASKHAVLGLTRALAAEFATTGVRINAVSPGPVRTGMTRDLGGDQSDWMEPGEVADVVQYLCSAHAGAVTGADVAVPGRGTPAGL